MIIPLKFDHYEFWFLDSNLRFKRNMSYNICSLYFVIFSAITSLHTVEEQCTVQPLTWASSYQPPAQSEAQAKRKTPQDLERETREREKELHKLVLIAVKWVLASCFLLFLVKLFDIFFSWSKLVTSCILFHSVVQSTFRCWKSFCR